ncbi:MAG TPA: DUF3108 domain-containing protein [Candidatus Krumholzibacteria bacterium]|nr:DUF3108 domain-containing protein [Candidatus Krumholzibacteria bacterium]
MNVRVSLLIALLSLVAGVAASPPGDGAADTAVTFYDSLYANELMPDSFTTVKPGAAPFGAGERLVYSVQYGLVTAGEATLEVRNLATLDGRTCYRIVSDARTNEFFSKFFEVRDRYESYMDTTELYSRRYEKHVREGKFKSDDVVDFDQTAHRARYKDKVVPIPPRTQDVLSAMYYVRTLPLEVGQAISLANHTDGKNYPLVIKVLRREHVKVDAGEFDCIVVEPILRGPGVFTQQGRLTVWLTDDKRRMPVLMKSKVVIGHVAAILKSYSGVKP